MAKVTEFAFVCGGGGEKTEDFEGFWTPFIFYASQKFNTDMNAFKHFHGSEKEP